MMFSLILSIVLIFVPQIVASPTGGDLNLPIQRNAEIAKEEENFISLFGGGENYGRVELPQAEPRPPRKKEGSISLGIETTARAALVLDRKTMSVLFEKNSREKISLASLTKIMTALVVLDNDPDWKKIIKLSRADDREGGIVYARYPEEVMVEDLFKMSIIGSVNNAAVALSRSIGLTEKEFVARMNDRAEELRLNNTIFADPTGLLPENQGTAQDVAKLLAEALSREEIQKAVIQKRYVFSPQKSEKVYYVKSTNELLWSFLNEEPYKFIGGKTGYIEESGYNLAVEVERQGNKIIVVVLGSVSAKERFKEIKGLVDWTFDNYNW